VSPVPFFDIAKHAHAAGFRGEPHAIVVALAQPESSRIATAHNGADPNSGSFGLLQINGVHLNEGGTLEGWTPDDLYDPAKNLLAAYKVWKANGESFEPWGAYVNGLHRPSLDAAKVALDGLSRWRAAEARAANLRVIVDARNLTIERLTEELADATSRIARVREALA
jgi:hypothetical protein